jgi:Phytanoyl-CoA dioxygenase (PhyH)
MRNVNEIQNPAIAHRMTNVEARRFNAESLVAELESNGIVVLPQLLHTDRLRDMQRAFEVRLRRIRWNNFDGYQKSEPYRHMIEDILLLDQGFVDLALHPLVKQILTRYLGSQYALTEAKGWKSLPTKRDFHGWHGDAWYDQTQVNEIHREIKLAMYLTDVRSGAFNYIKGSHRRQHPRLVKNGEISNERRSQITELMGPAGTAFLFDTSGVHRQGVPMLESRQAIFYNYHDPGIPLQEEDVTFYRYHPLLLNAAFLGNLSSEDQRILGFGDKTNFQPAFARPDNPPATYRVFSATFDSMVRLRDLREMIGAKLRRTFGKR